MSEQVTEKPLTELDFTECHTSKGDKTPQTISRPCLCCDAICSPVDSEMFAPASRCSRFHRKEIGREG